MLAGKLPANVHYQDEDIFIFDNQLDWVPVMVLLIPKRHMTQAELWTSGDLFTRMNGLAVELGARLCPGGFRLLSNFGPDGMQSQPHGHLHLVGGERLGPYINQGLD